MTKPQWVRQQSAFYTAMDSLSGAIIILMTVFAPWAFGTTEEWSMNIMNAGGYLLGGMLLLKWFYLSRTGFVPAGSRQDTELSETSAALKRARLLAILTGAILAYCLVSAVNARALYIPLDGRFEYRDCINWLPHSYDRRASWRAFFNYAGLACFFWSLRAWILAPTEEKRGPRASRSKSKHKTSSDRPSTGTEAGLVENLGFGEDLEGNKRRRIDSRLLGKRLRIFLWVLCLNGTLVASEGLLQRISGTTKLLWLVETHINKEPSDHLGPYAYRGNGVQYLNLVWPVAVGLWWSAGRSGSRKRRALYDMLLPCAVIMAGAVLFSLSRAGAFVCVVGIMMTTVLLLAPLRAGWGAKGAAFALGIVALAIAGKLISGNLEYRFRTMSIAEDRTEMFRAGWRMAKDFPVFGSGPNSLNSVYQLYRTSPDGYWPAQLHNDWLETFITFGGAGMALILGALYLVLRHWFVSEGIPADGTTVAFFWLSLGGCLTHALVDFPLQIYSVLLVVLSICAVLFTLSRKRRDR